MKIFEFHAFITFIAALLVTSMTAFAAPHPEKIVLVVSSFGTDNVLRYNRKTGEFIDVFASGGGLDGPGGIVFGPDDNLYIGSEENDSVLRYNGVTGAFIDVFASGGGLGIPEGLVFGPDGNLYITSIATNDVKRYDGETGEFIGVFASGGGLSVPALGLTFFHGKKIKN